MDPVTLDVLPPSAASAHASASTTDLVVRAGKGDASAYESLIRERLDSLYRTAWAILGNEADARDATQDACLSAWRNLSRLREPDRFDAWLTRILVNGCRMRLRIRSRVREIPMESDLDRPGPTTDDPSSQAEADAIARAFDRLSADARADASEASINCTRAASSRCDRSAVGDVASGTTDDESPSIARASATA